MPAAGRRRAPRIARWASSLLWVMCVAFESEESDRHTRSCARSNRCIGHSCGMTSDRRFESCTRYTTTTTLRPIQATAARSGRDGFHGSRGFGARNRNARRRFPRSGRFTGFGLGPEPAVWHDSPSLKTKKARSRSPAAGLFHAETIVLHRPSAFRVPGSKPASSQWASHLEIVPLDCSPQRSFSQS